MKAAGTHQGGMVQQTNVSLLQHGEAVPGIGLTAEIAVTIFKQKDDDNLELGAALWRNLFGGDEGVEDGNVERVAVYMRREAAKLEAEQARIEAERVKVEAAAAAEAQRKQAEAARLARLKKMEAKPMVAYYAVGAVEPNFVEFYVRPKPKAPAGPAPGSDR